jgi:hypothetical protein
MTQPSRAPTTLAVGFLALDALLLSYGGLAWRRPLLVGAAVACAATGAAVLIAWRRYRRTLGEIDVARHDLPKEIASIRELLQSQHSQN